MALSIAEGRNLLTAYEFKTLFIEKLGWNRYKAKLEISVDGETFTLLAISEKCGMAAFVCDPGADGRIPDYPMRRKIERQVAKSVHEHLVIFTDKKRSTQIWQWVRREQGKPAACREHPYQIGQPGDSLIQKIRALAVSLEEEEGLTLPDVTGRARKAFDVERVTKKFYDRFKSEHAAFLSFLDGIPDKEMERWYVSVMLNRLMFVYFIQKKGFLGGGDTDYLKNKLTLCRTELGKDRYYRDLLCPLFFEGFAKKKEERSEKARRLLGEVPYLNGGIFMPHQIEQLFGKTIAIPDKAFDKLFEFFDAYHWHLDERPLKKDDEINPDVLGYIFEKYINQKQMGAYYTKEDITEYISKNTVIPFLFDAAREKCKIDFGGQRSVWRLLQEDPDRYIYKAVRHGMSWNHRPRSIDKNEGEPLPRPLPLPPAIEEGVDPAKPNLLERRKSWNRPAPPNYALPTEIWREVVARRKRYEEVRGKLAVGEIRTVNDFITYNLDIRQFAQDVVENAEGPELLVAFWKALEAVRVLDPTCGSGAFLFAALNILDPLYEACLERMRFFLDEWGETGKKNHPNYYRLFTDTLKRVEEHPNHRYFVLKSIIINNLYGVDIMEEAVEICKLRLFLKLVAQIERAKDIEPLPDIDFNIRAGNTLVGFTKLEEVRSAAEKESSGQGRIIFGETEEQIKRLEEEADVADRAFRKFRDMQTQQGMSPKDFSEAKENLRSRLKKLTNELDRFLASEYGINEGNIPNKKKFEDAYENWRKSHQPFHWFAEFYGILKAGGFDVIIGNPPYVEYEKVNKLYSVHGYRTQECGNLFAVITERSLGILRLGGRLSFIIPVASTCTDGYLSLQRLLRESGDLVFSSYNDRPGRLFEGLEHIRQSIIISHRTNRKPTYIYSTKYNRWNTIERPFLFPRLTYVETAIGIREGSIPKLSSPFEYSILSKINNEARTLDYLITKVGKHLIYYTRKLSGFVQILNFVPLIYDEQGKRRKPSELKELPFSSNETRDVSLATLNSSLFYWFLTAYSDCRNLNKREVNWMPLNFDKLGRATLAVLSSLANRLMEDFRHKSKLLEMSYEQLGKLNVQCIYPKRSKEIIDEIDGVLAKHYGFTYEELDFIINYDIKYRMGKDVTEESQE